MCRETGGDLLTGAGIICFSTDCAAVTDRKILIRADIGIIEGAHQRAAQIAWLWRFLAEQV